MPCPDDGCGISRALTASEVTEQGAPCCIHRAGSLASGSCEDDVRCPWRGMGRRCIHRDPLRGHPCDSGEQCPFYPGWMRERLKQQKDKTARYADKLTEMREHLTKAREAEAAACARLSKAAMLLREVRREYLDPSSEMAERIRAFLQGD